MPIYSILCRDCGDKDIIHRKVYERDLLPLCDCGGKYERVIEAPMVIPEIAPYISPGTGKLVSSREQRRQDLRASKAYEWEPGIEKDIARKKEENIKESFIPIAKGIDDIVTSMNVAGKLD